MRYEIVPATPEHLRAIDPVEELPVPLFAVAGGVLRHSSAAAAVLVGGRPVAVVGVMRGTREVWAFVQRGLRFPEVRALLVALRELRRRAPASLEVAVEGPVFEKFARAVGVAVERKEEAA